MITGGELGVLEPLRALDDDDEGGGVRVGVRARPWSKVVRRGL
jgi:hypothetical protein